MAHGPEDTIERIWKMREPKKLTAPKFWWNVYRQTSTGVVYANQHHTHKLACAVHDGETRTLIARVYDTHWHGHEEGRFDEIVPAAEDQPMTDIDQLVERMESAAKAATPGEWSKASDQYDRPRVIDEYQWTLADMSTLAPNGPRFNAKKDATHIVEAQPQNVLTLIAEWRAQKAEIERLREALTLSADALEGTYGRVDYPATDDCDENVAYLAARKALETD